MEDIAEYSTREEIHESRMLHCSMRELPWREMLKEFDVFAMILAHATREAEINPIHEHDGLKRT